VDTFDDVLNQAYLLFFCLNMFLVLYCSYIGQIGDVVVGRIIQVAQRKWKVDTKSKLDSVLMLSSVNLPGGELVRMHRLDIL